jgi:hypothetical protein
VLKNACAIKSLADRQLQTLTRTGEPNVPNEPTVACANVLNEPTVLRRDGFVSGLAARPREKLPHSATFFVLNFKS